MKQLRDVAYAKINLMLRVVGKRENGYHELQMLNAKIDLHDDIIISTIDTDEVIVVFYPPIKIENNIVEKIAHDIKEKYNIKTGVKIDIYKYIPLASGMGGGSADAACVIHLMDKLFQLNLSLEDRQLIGLKFGADIPYMLIDKPAIVEGIGEKVYSLSQDITKEVLIINPAFPVSTKHIFQNVNQYSRVLDHGAITESISSNCLDQIISNDLMPIVKYIYPQINEVINGLATITNNIIFMTGSGPTLVVLLKNEISDLEIDKLKKANPEFYIKKHRII